MPQAHDFSKSLVPFENDTTLLAVIELSQSSWLIAGSVPGLRPATFEEDPTRRKDIVARFAPVAR